MASVLKENLDTAHHASYFSISHEDQEDYSSELELTQSYDKERNFNLSCNGTNTTSWELPMEMRFNDAHVLSIVAYSILMVFSAVSNTTVLVTICRFRPKSRLNRINLLLLHLAVADLLVTFLLMPLEIGWAATVSWRAGDAACRAMAFFRTFGLYLSGFILVCISLDRYFAVVKPLDGHDADRRGRIMLCLAWIASGVCSIPQAVVFHVESHPIATWFTQCVTFNSFPSRQAELMYYAFGFTFLYGFPLCMILTCYVKILWKISRANKQMDDLRRSSTELLSRAKIKTLKLTITIVATFFMCWTPYNVMALWYWIDSQSARQVDQRIQKGLFLFACTNSCFNPLVYGYFHFSKRRAVKTSCGMQQGRFHRANHTQNCRCKFRVRWIRPEEVEVSGYPRNLTVVTGDDADGSSTKVGTTAIANTLPKSPSPHLSIVYDPTAT